MPNYNSESNVTRGNPNVAAANLNQLTYFMEINGDKKIAIAVLPEPRIHHVQQIFIDSLQRLGFSNEEASIQNHDGGDLLQFSESGVNKLIEAGIKSPVLDVFRERVPAALSLR